MKEFIIGTNDAGQRLDRWLQKAVPLLPAGLAQKYIRLKRVKINGKASKRDARLQKGDVLQLYLNDEFFQAPREDNAYQFIAQPRLRIVYEDDFLLVCSKPPGLLCHADGREYTNTLIAHMQAYLYQKGEWNPKKENTFTPALCNRIDRNTGGLVLAAKTAEALRILNDKIKNREISKFYLAAVLGKMNPPQGELQSFLLRDERKRQVSVYHRPVPGGKSAITHYRTLAFQSGLSLVECALLTGRTHQIRAQFADAGHPLAGDEKYGAFMENRKLERFHQALWAYKMTFDFPTSAGCLEALRGLTLHVPLSEIDFVSQWFPEWIQTGKLCL